MYEKLMFLKDCIEMCKRELREAVTTEERNRYAQELFELREEFAQVAAA